MIIMLMKIMLMKMMMFIMDDVDDDYDVDGGVYEVDGYDVDYLDDDDDYYDVDGGVYG